jgi:general stress protein 26
MSKEKLYGLIEEIETAMFTTRRSDGRLVSRPMATQKQSAGADFWFVTSRDSEKLIEIGENPQVNLAYYKDRTREWVSVSGTARIVDDREKVRELYEPDWRAWFGDEGAPNDGGANDPRMVLIGVDLEMAMYLELNKPQAVVLFEVVKGIITGKQPDVGQVKVVE